MPKPAGSGVSLAPSSFSDDLPDLSTLSLEDVVARFKDTEKRRNTSTEPPNEAEVHWMIRSAPVELMSSLKIVAAKLGVSRSILTKCMSHQVADWYTNALGLGDLAVGYNEVYGKIKLRGYTSLRIQAERPAHFGFDYHAEPVQTSISSIQWVVAKLAEVREIIGVRSNDLLLIGFCWSLTTLGNKDWDEVNIKSYFLPDAGSMGLLIKDRLVDVDALEKKYQLREDIASCNIANCNNATPLGTKDITI